MVTVKSLKDWENVFLDTGVVLALFRCQDVTLKDERMLFVKDLVSYLAKSNTQYKKKRRFLISTITLSEILCKENESEKIKRILNVLDSDNVEFLDFDLATALLFNKDLHEHLSRVKLNEYAGEFGFKTGDFMMAREWIHRDLMILETAKNYEVDVILSLDEKTFLPAANKINVPCVLCLDKNFNHEKGVFFSFTGN